MSEKLTFTATTFKWLSQSKPIKTHKNTRHPITVRKFESHLSVTEHEFAPLVLLIYIFKINLSPHHKL